MVASVGSSETSESIVISSPASLKGEPMASPSSSHGPEPP